MQSILMNVTSHSHNHLNAVLQMQCHTIYKGQISLPWAAMIRLCYSESATTGISRTYDLTQNVSFQKTSPQKRIKEHALHP